MENFLLSLLKDRSLEYGVIIKHHFLRTTAQTLNEPIMQCSCIKWSSEANLLENGLIQQSM